MPYHLYAQTVYAVRPKKGEARHQGMLKKPTRIYVESITEAKAELKALALVLNSPGYSRILSASLHEYNPNRAYGDEIGALVKEWNADEISSL